MKSSIPKIENVRHDYALQDHDQPKVSYIKTHWKLALCILPSPMLHAFNLLLCLLKAIKVIAIPCMMVIAVFHSLCLSAQTPRKDSGVNGQVKYELTGVVVSSTDGTPLQGVSVRIEAENLQIKTSKDGKFKLTVSNKSGKIRFSSIGYISQELNYTTGVSMIVKLIPEDNQLDEVEVVSTGYQKIPKERATGSFVQIDNELLNRTVSTNVLDRLEGVASGVVFDKSNISNTNKSGISIRGRSTLFSNDEPLIILDNFPYSGDIDALNPNDIASISILKDAGAASIWGARAGNGVIVITTKKGSQSSKTRINLLSNLSLSGKPNLYYPSQMSSSEYIELESFLYEKGRYNTAIANGYGEISPVVSLLEKLRKGELTPSSVNERLAYLSTIDTRKDLERWYGTALRQQYAVNIQGGSERYTYYGSYGFDKNQQAINTTNNSRHTINFNSSIKLIDKFVNLTNLIQFSDNTNRDNSRSSNINYPYLDLIGNNDEALAVSDGTLNLRYATNPESDQLLDWLYRPWDENKVNHLTGTQSIRAGAGLELKPLNWLVMKGEYMLQRNNNQSEILYEKGFLLRAKYGKYL